MTQKQVREYMQKLGIYKSEYETTIKRYAEMQTQYNKLLKATKKQPDWYAEKTAAGTKKSALAGTLENLRKDLLAYETALGLTPAGLKKVSVEKPAEKKKKSTGIVLMPRAGGAGDK